MTRPTLLTQNSGLLEQIRSAESVIDVAALLAKGKTYDRASRKTMRKWERAARKRIEELRGGRP